MESHRWWYRHVGWRFIHALGLAAFLLAAPTHAEQVSPGNAALKALAANPPGVQFTSVRTNPSIAGISRELMSFNWDGLTQYALVLRPAGEPPAEGWPVLVFNHGFHPDPPRHGKRSSDGKDDRPGDYYRGLPQSYAAAGYVVVAPDYRGHNVSEGAAYTSRALATYWYVRDVLGAFFAAQSLGNVNASEVVMVGHSMGGYITQRALLALGDRITAASIWSTSGEDVETYLYSVDLADSVSDSSEAGAGARSAQLGKELDDLPGGAAAIKTLIHLETLETPLLIQHARDDGTTPLWGSLAVAARLRLADKPFQLQIYEGGDHLFTGADRDEAVRRDLAWFSRWRESDGN